MRAPPHAPKRVTFADVPPDTTDCVVVHYTPLHGGTTDKIHCTYVRSAHAWRWQSRAKIGRTRDGAPMQLCRQGGSPATALQ
eukprot:289311-Amphidinium_carterae.1